MNAFFSYKPQAPKKVTDFFKTSSLIINNNLFCSMYKILNKDFLLLRMKT